MAVWCSNSITVITTDSEWKEICSAFSKDQVDWPQDAGDVSFSDYSSQLMFGTKYSPSPWQNGKMAKLSESYPSVIFNYVADIEGERYPISVWFCNGEEGEKSGVENNRKQAYTDYIERLSSASIGVAEGIMHRIEEMPDGRVASDGENRFGECNIFSWKNIVAVSCGNWHTVGLCDDGTVVACGSNANGQCDVSDLEDKAIAVSCGRYHTAILLKSGKVVIKGKTEQSVKIPKANCGFYEESGNLGDYVQTRVSLWRPVSKIVSVYDAVIGVTDDDEMFIDGFCPCSVAEIRKMISAK